MADQHSKSGQEWVIRAAKWLLPKRIRSYCDDFPTWDNDPRNIKRFALEEAEELFALVLEALPALAKETGYLSPKEYQEIIAELADIQAEVKVALIRDARVGYVQLAGDQTLTLVVKDAEGQTDGLDEFARGQQFAQEGMLEGDSKGVWRKVKPEDKDV